METSKSSSFQEPKSYSMDMIKGVSWAEPMYEVLDDSLKKSFIDWVTIVTAMTHNEADLEGWKSSFIALFKERCCELVSDIKERYDEVVVNVEKYLTRVQALCEMLQIEMPIFGQNKLGLYEEQLYLKRHLNELEQILKTRQDEINKLRNKQLTFCQVLGMEPRIINDDPLPSSTEISEFQRHIEELEQEKFNREEQFFIIKEKLVQIIEELDYVPNTKFERDVMFAKESNFVLTETNMESLKNFHSKMEQKWEQVREDIGQLRNKVEQLWALLDLDFREREDFRNKYTGNSLKIMESLQTELQRCEELKRTNIKVFVIKLRQDLEEIWERCQCSDTVKNDFVFFYSDCFSEDLLELHEVQLEKWRTYAEENKEILNLLNKHQQLWNKMLELEESASGPGRYTNRGGKLLREEKERNLLAKQIPEIEKNLMILSEKYQAHYNTPFLTYGEPIETYINNLHVTRENAKKLKLSARKAQKDVTPLLSNTKCSSTFRQGTSTPMSKRKIDFHLVNVKETGTPLKALSKDKTRINLLKLPKITTSNFSSLTTITRSKRLSTERKKRIDKIRQQDRKRDCRNSSTYIEFQNTFNDREDLRSTMIFSSAENQPPAASSKHNITKTPQKLAPPKTPKSLTKSPNSQAKLTTLKTQTKLIF